jgi:hypothetical protein
MSPRAKAIGIGTGLVGIGLGALVCFGLSKLFQARLDMKNV